VLQYSSDYATVVDQGAYSAVSPDYDQLLLNPPDSCPQVTYAEVNKNKTKCRNYKNAVNSSNEIPNATATKEVTDVENKAVYATVNKNR